MKTWLHRISWQAQASYPLLASNYLSIGFSDFGTNPEFIDNALKHGKEFIYKYSQQKWGKMPRNLMCLLRFIVEMSAGDQVLVPGWKTFSLYEICDNRPLRIAEVDLSATKTLDGRDMVVKDGYLYGAEKDAIDLGFARKVKLVVQDVPREGYCDAALSSRLKIRITTADITDLSMSIDGAITAYREKKPIKLQFQIMDQTVEAIAHLIREKVNPSQFEQLIGWYFERAGATLVELPSKNERDKKGDADIIATFDPIRTIIYVQAKHHVGEEDDWAVQQVMAYKEQKAVDSDYTRVAWVISMCDRFSEKCMALAEENDVMLFDGKAFAELLLNAGISGMRV